MKKVRPKHDKLNVGCGNDIREGYVNLDFYKFKGVDVVHDIEKTPFPFPANSFSRVLMSHVLEHVEDPVETMEEIWRICKKDAVVEIGVPYFSGLNAVKDPTHKKFFAAATFDFFEKTKIGERNYFVESRKIDFEILERKIIYSKNAVLRIFNPVLNLNHKFYERFFAYVFPAQLLEVKLKVKK